MSGTFHTPERPQDEIRFGSGAETDWDKFLQSGFYVTLVGGQGDEPLAPLIKTSPSINDGQPYFVLTSGEPALIAEPGELLETYVTGRQALDLTPPGVSILVDDLTLRADSEQIAYLRSELERLGNPDLLLEDLMIRFGFTAEDLEANRAGTLTDRQRERLQRRLRNESALTVFVYGCGALFVFVTLGAVLGATAGAWLRGAGAAGLFLTAVMGRWWHQHHYPLGEHRVKMMIAETHQDVHASKTRTLSRVGRGVGGRWLPQTIPAGTLVRLYWNTGPANETLVHSIEPARVGDQPNDGTRNLVGRILVVLFLIGLVAAMVFF